MTPLSLADLLTLPAGRELDAEIAKLQDHTIKWDAWTKGEPYIVTQVKDDEGKQWEDGRIVPRYSIGWADSEPLLAEMLAGELGVSLSNTGNGGIRFRAWNVRQNYIADVPSLADAPLAICRAWATWKMGGEA